MSRGTIDDQMAGLVETFKGLQEGIDDVDGRLNVLDQIQSMVAKHENRFDGIDNALVDHYQRLNGIDQRIDGVEGRLGGIDGRLEDIDDKLEGVNSRLDRTDQRVDNIEQMTYLMLRAVYDLSKSVQTVIKIDFDPDSYLPEVAEQLSLPYLADDDRGE